MFLRTFESFTYLAFLLHLYFLEIIHFDLINSINPRGHFAPVWIVLTQREARK